MNHIIRSHVAKLLLEHFHVPGPRVGWMCCWESRPPATRVLHVSSLLYESAQDADWTVRQPGPPTPAWLWHLFFTMKDQMLRLLGCQATAEHRARRRGSFIALRPMATSPISLPLLEGKHSQAVGAAWAVNRGPAVCLLRSGTRLLICNGGDVSARLPSEATGWTFLMVNTLTVV